MVIKVPTRGADPLGSCFIFDQRLDPHQQTSPVVDSFIHSNVEIPVVHVGGGSERLAIWIDFVESCT